MSQIHLFPPQAHQFAYPQTQTAGDVIVIRFADDIVMGFQNKGIPPPGTAAIGGWLTGAQVVSPVFITLV